MFVTESAAHWINRSLDNTLISINTPLFWPVGVFQNSIQIHWLNWALLSSLPLQAGETQSRNYLNILHNFSSCLLKLKWETIHWTQGRQGHKGERKYITVHGCYGLIALLDGRQQGYTPITGCLSHLGNLPTLCPRQCACVCVCAYLPTIPNYVGHSWILVHCPICCRLNVSHFTYTGRWSGRDFNTNVNCIFVNPFSAKGEFD